MKDLITAAVIEDLKSRSERGIAKYNTTLDQNNKDDYMQHAYEEALDLAQYLKKEMSIIPLIQNMMDQYSDDQELGKHIRETFARRK
jgi:hypothetical protein